MAQCPTVFIRNFPPVLNSYHVFRFFFFFQIVLTIIVLLVPIVILFEGFSNQRIIKVRRILIVSEYLLGFAKTLKEKGDVDDILFNSMRPRGSQPARLHGLAKVHKGVPMRPILSMPGSAYHRVALKVTEWLSVVEECKINSSTTSISQS